MFQMKNMTASPLIDSRPGDRMVNVDALTRRRLGELEMLFDVGVERLTAIPTHLSGDPFKAATAFERVTRALRQITVLEQELLGLRKAPRRDAPPRTIAEKMARGHDPMRLTRMSPSELSLSDLRERSGYSNGPLDKVVAGIRKVLDVPCPTDDPFAPDAGRKAAERRETADAPPAKATTSPEPETATRPNQTALALKAATLAIRANPRKGGFRLPKKARKPAATRHAPEHHGQGPPG